MSGPGFDPLFVLTDRRREFFNGGWKPARGKAIAAGLTKSPRVHDLRHTCASWMIVAGVPLPVIQQHLRHESIQTTIGVYGHLARRGAQAAATPSAQHSDDAILGQFSLPYRSGPACDR